MKTTAPNSSPRNSRLPAAGGIELELLDRPIPVDQFQPGVFTTLTSLPAENRAGKRDTPPNFPFIGLHLKRVLSNGISSGLLPLLPKEPAALEQEILKLFQNRIDNTPDFENCELIARIILTGIGPEILKPKFFLTLGRYERSRPAGSSLTLQTIAALRPNPAIKSTDLQICRAAAAEAQMKGADEALLVNCCADGSPIVGECAWSNLFWVDAGQQILTVKEGILPGITRGIVLKIAAAEEQDAPVTVEDLCQQALELFVTQSTSGISPVSAIDGRKIGNGRPGPVTLQLIERYEAERRKSSVPSADLTEKR